MKRFIAIAGILVVLLAAGWSLFWWLGRDALARAVDAEVARLETAGWEIDWADRAFGGFPFGYTMQLTELSATDPASGFALRLPSATVETEGAGTVLVRLPESFAADLPLPAGAAASGADVPAVAQTTAESQGLVMRLAGAGAAERSVDVDAESLVWSLTLPGSDKEQTVTFEGLDAGMTSDGTGSTFRLQAGRYGIEAAIPEGEAPASAMTASYRNFAVTGSATVPNPEALAEMLYAGAPGQAEMALQAGPAEGRVVGGQGEARATLDWQSGSISAVAALSSGRMDLEAETRENAWKLTPEVPDAMLAGGFSAGAVQAIYGMPMAPAPEPDDMAIRLALLDVALDEAAWQAIDPEGALPHEPGELVMDLTGLARVTRRIDEMQPGSPPPFEVRELTVNEIAVEALGAAAHATGSVEILQPIGLPLGTLHVSLTGAAALIGGLGEAGVLTPEQVDMADAILTVYARPAEGKDAWTTDITFTNEGPLVNGLPVR